ncbi:MAG: hypothetical protein M1829_005109 [Trizodia sp. TS-e1964]|nr:MAG: hypothetical protein M1829_005109 [Trizodia sp. TS-e1964]
MLYSISPAFLLLALTPSLPTLATTPPKEREFFGTLKPLRKQGIFEIKYVGENLAVTSYITPTSQDACGLVATRVGPLLTCDPDKVDPNDSKLELVDGKLLKAKMTEHAYWQLGAQINQMEESVALKPSNAAAFEIVLDRSIEFPAYAWTMERGAAEPTPPGV